jgi:hypothetical protein
MALALRTPPDPSVWPTDHAGQDVHAMSGLEFEDLLAVAFQRCGYGVELAERSVSGAGLVVTRGGWRWFAQARRQDRAVDCSAVDQAIHGGAAHACATSLVVATSVYTRGTIAYARQHGVTLWDQHDLADLLQAAALTQPAPPVAPECPRCHLPMTYEPRLGAGWCCPNRWSAVQCSETVPYRALAMRVVVRRPPTGGARVLQVP